MTHMDVIVMMMLITVLFFNCILLWLLLLLFFLCLWWWQWSWWWWWVQSTCRQVQCLKFPITQCRYPWQSNGGSKWISFSLQIFTIIILMYPEHLQASLNLGWLILHFRLLPNASYCMSLSKRLLKQEGGCPFGVEVTGDLRALKKNMKGNILKPSKKIGDPPLGLQPLISLGGDDCAYA